MSIVIPNNFPNLKLFERVPPERKDGPSTDRTLDVVAWLPSDKGNRLIPITICGVPPMAPGAQYALLNTADKSYTTLDGLRFVDYKTWLVHEESKAAVAPAPVAEAAPVAVAPVPDLSRSPKPWFEPERRGR